MNELTLIFFRQGVRAVISHFKEAPQSLVRFTNSHHTPQAILLGLEGTYLPLINIVALSQCINIRIRPRNDRHWYYSLPICCYFTE